MPHQSQEQRIRERRLRRAWADLRFHASALRDLRGPLIALIVIWTLGTVVQRYFGAPPGGVNPTWNEAVFIAYNLLLVEHNVPLPANLVGELSHYLLPIAGVVVLAEGVIKLGIRTFKKEVQREKWMQVLASSSRGHVILCGLGTVGFRVLEELIGLGEQVFVIERNADSPLLDQARALGVEVCIGDARTENLLRSLNVEGARAVIVATDDDLANLEIAMDVREIRRDIPIVLRLFDQRLAEKVKGPLGIAATFSTSRTAAPIFAAAALDPGVVGAHRVGNDVLVVIEIIVKAGSTFERSALSTLTGSSRLTIVAIRRGQAPWEPQPPGDARLKAGDGVQVMVHGHRVAEVHSLNEEG